MKVGANVTSNVLLIVRLSLVLAIVWMVKQKGLSPALHHLPQVTSKGKIDVQYFINIDMKSPCLTIK